MGETITFRERYVKKEEKAWQIDILLWIYFDTMKILSMQAKWTASLVNPLRIEDSTGEHPRSPTRGHQQSSHLPGLSTSSTGRDWQMGEPGSTWPAKIVKINPTSEMLTTSIYFPERNVTYQAFYFINIWNTR